MDAFYASSPPDKVIATGRKRTLIATPLDRGQPQCRPADFEVAAWSGFTGSAGRPIGALISIEKRAVAEHGLPETRGQNDAVGGGHHKRQRLGIDLDLRKYRPITAVREIADL